MLQRLYDLTKGRPTRGLHAPALVNQLQKPLIVSVVDAKGLSALDLGPDLTRLESIEGNAALERLPEQRAKGKHVDLLVVLPLLEQFGRHVARRARKLHRSRPQVRLEHHAASKQYQFAHAMMTMIMICAVLTMKRARPKSQTFTLKLASMSTL